MNTRCWLFLAFGVVGFAAECSAADWPQWRGPDRNGKSTETGLLKEWPKEGPKLIWQASDIKQGYGSPAVASDRVYVISNFQDEESLLALDVKEGKTLWTTRIGKVGVNKGPQYPGSRSTPTVEGDSIYCLSSDGDLCALEREKGSLRWQKSLSKDFEGQPGNWAYAESPLVDGDAVVCTPGGKAATLVALNKKTGDVIWKCAVPSSQPEGERAAYSSIIVTETGGIKEYVQFLQKGVVGVEAKTGKLLWRYDKTADGSPANIPTPVAYDDFVYSGAGRTGGGLVKLKVEKESVTAEPVYFKKDLPTSIGGAVEVGKYLYGTNARGLLCADFANGELKWQEKCVGPASLLFADERLYLHGENGDVALVEATSEGYHEKGHFSPPEQPKQVSRGARAWAYPAIANGRLYLRDQNSLWCYDVRAVK